MQICGKDFTKVDFEPTDQRCVLTLLLLDQFVTIVLVRLQCILIVDKVADNESEIGCTVINPDIANLLSFTAICFVLFNDLLEQSDRVQGVLLIFGYSLGGTGHNHVGEGGVRCFPILGQNSKN